MLYFAYGSNLDPEQMQSRCPGYSVVGLGALRDYRLAFPLYSNHWQGGVSSIQLAHGGTVWGMLYDLTEEHLEGQRRVAYESLSTMSSRGRSVEVPECQLPTLDRAPPSFEYVQG